MEDAHQKVLEAQAALQAAQEALQAAQGGQGTQGDQGESSGPQKTNATSVTAGSVIDTIINKLDYGTYTSYDVPAFLVDSSGQVVFKNPVT